MDLGLRASTVLITGGSRGIGAGAARVFAAEGAHLILVGRDQSALSTVKADILASASVSVETAVCDVSSGEAVRALAARFGPRVNILVNNAGAVPGGDLFAVDEARWRAGWDTKVFAYVNMCRAFYPHLKERGGGVIVNVLGAGSQQKRFDYICGGMANASLDFFTETLGAHAPADNVRVVGVSPGPVATERYKSITEQRLNSNPGMAPPKTPFGRIATPEELGRTIAFAASPASSYTSGTIITVDGGMSVRKYAPL
jgi:NAD(P)-dependent dehydrogenase (short-subunit alcohol dehydrogenase family)